VDHGGQELTDSPPIAHHKAQWYVVKTDMTGCFCSVQIDDRISFLSQNWTRAQAAG